MSVRVYCVLAKADEGDHTQGRLAELAWMDKTTMVVTLDEMERRGLAERRLSPEDRRVRVVAITARGARQLAKADAIVQGVYDEVLDAVNAGGARDLPVGARRARRRSAGGAVPHGGADAQERPSAQVERSGQGSSITKPSATVRSCPDRRRQHPTHPAARTRRPVRGHAHDDRRRDRRLRRPAEHPARSRLRDLRPVLGRQRLPGLASAACCCWPGGSATSWAADACCSAASASSSPPRCSAASRSRPAGSSPRASCRAPAVRSPRRSHSAWSSRSSTIRACRPVRSGSTRSSARPAPRSACSSGASSPTSSTGAGSSSSTSRSASRRCWPAAGSWPSRAVPGCARAPTSPARCCWWRASCSRSSPSWTPTRAPSGSSAAALLALFVLRQATARRPLLPLGVLRNRVVAGANVVHALHVAAMFGFQFLVTLYFQRVLGYSPAQAGLAVLPVAMGIGAMSLARVPPDRAALRRPRGAAARAPRDRRRARPAGARAGRRALPRGRGAERRAVRGRRRARAPRGHDDRDVRRDPVDRRPRVGSHQHVPAGRRGARARRSWRRSRRAGRMACATTVSASPTPRSPGSTSPGGSPPCSS